MLKRCVLLFLTFFCVVHFSMATRAVKIFGLDNSAPCLLYDYCRDLKGHTLEILNCAMGDIQQLVLEKLNNKWFSVEIAKTDNSYLYLLLVFMILIIILMMTIIVFIVRSEQKVRSRGDEVEKINEELIETLNQLINRGDIKVYLYELSTKLVYAQRNGRKISSDQANFLELTGLLSQEIVGFKHMVESLDVDQKEEVSICEVYMVDNKPCHFEYTLTPVRQNGVLSRYIILRQDVSRIKLDLAKKNETIEIIEMALSLTESTVWKYNTKTKISSILMNNGKEVALDPASTKDIVHPSDIKLAHEFFKKVMAGEDVSLTTLRIRMRAYDDYGVCKINARSRLDLASDNIIVYGVLTDITEHYNSQKKVESLQDNLKLALDVAQLTAWTYHVKEDEFVHHHGERVAGMNMNLEKITATAHPEDVFLIKDAEHEILVKHRGRVEAKLRLKREDEYRWFSCLMQPIYAKDGTIKKIVGTSRDITEEMKLNIELKNTKENLQTILDKLPIPICIKDAESQTFLYRNYATTRLSHIGVDLKDALSPESYERIKNVDLEILRTKMNYSANEINQLSSGEIRYTTVNKVLINYEGKECILGLRYDYTDHHRLDQANKLFYMSMPSIKAYTWNIDGRGMKVTYNNVSDVGGIPIENISTIEDFLVYVHPEDRARLTKQIYDTFGNGSCEVVMSYRIKNINDEYEWWESRAIAEIITEGALEYPLMYGMAINVNENKLNELSLIKLNQQNELILNNHSSGIAYIDSHNVVQWTNMSENKYSRLYEFFKHNNERGVLCNCARDESEVCPLLEAKSYGKIANSTYEWLGMTLDVCFTPITDYKGENGMVVRIDDVTEKQKMVRELEIAKEKAEESEKLKMSFLANMSHEIRTPLNAIIGFSELLCEEDPDDMRKEYADIIQKNSDTLLRLIGDILDLSKIESGNIEVKPKQFDFGAFINDTYKAWETRSKETDLEVFLEHEYESKDLVLDQKIVEQVINNYMSNAFKYTPCGSVTLGCDYMDKGVKIYVKDTGIGVPMEKQHLTFQRFAKLDEFAQGTGLGLSICRGLAESCNGEVGFESVPDKGSTFWVFFPCTV